MTKAMIVIKDPTPKNTLDLDGRVKAYVNNYLSGQTVQEAYKNTGYNADPANAWRFHRSELTQAEISKQLSPEAITQRIEDLFQETKLIDKPQPRIETGLKCVDRLMQCKGIGKQDVHIDNRSISVSDVDTARLQAICEDLKGMRQQLADPQGRQTGIVKPNSTNNIDTNEQDQ